VALTKQQIGKVRWTVLAMLFAVTVINYAVRAALSGSAFFVQGAGDRRPATGLDLLRFRLGLCGGAIARRLAARSFRAPRVYFWAIVIWSMITAAHGAVVWMSGATAVTVLFVLRFLVGFAEGPSFPGNARIVASWFPARERGTASAIFNAAQYFATVLFAPLMGWIVADFGWPWVLWRWAPLACSPPGSGLRWCARPAITRDLARPKWR
jgi:ACS family glucarate transporter-like MFS transporter